MKLLTYLQNSTEKWGFLLERPEGSYVCCPQDVEDNLWQIRKAGSVFRLGQTAFMPSGKWPEELSAFLALGEEGMAVLQRMHDFMQRYAFEQDAYWCSRYIKPLEEVTLKAPIPRPRIYWGLVANCPSFCRLDANRKVYNLVPQGHNRPQSCCVGMGETVILDESNMHRDPNLFDFAVGFNVELGVIIGRKGRNIKAKDAMQYVAGYTNVMDLSTMDYFDAYDPVGTSVEDKRSDRDFFIAAAASWGGKKMDCMAPMGPYLVTRDEIINPYDLLAYTRQNGMQRDRCWTGALMLGIERTIEYYSSFATLYPGDVLHMATMGIDGLTITEDVVPGPEDTLEAEIEKLGALKIHICRPAVNDWRTPEDPTRGQYRAPSVRDAVNRGKAESAKFCPEETRNFIIAFGNYSSCMEAEGLLPVTDIPRFMNNPVSALTTGSSTTLASRVTGVDLSIELALVLKKITAKVAAEEVDEYILGYTPLVAVLDNSLYEDLNKPATGQETGLTRYVYSRWGDGYNMVLADPVNICMDTLYSRRMELSVDGVGSVAANTGDYLVKAGDMISAISQRTTLMPNDVITLGRVGKLLHVSAEQVEKGFSGKASIEGIGEITFRFEKSGTAAQ